METCNDCYYGRDFGNDQAVVCRRYPPTVTRVDEAQQIIISHSPIVNKKWWCGEWKHRVNGKVPSGTETTISSGRPTDA